MFSLATFQSVTDIMDGAYIYCFWKTSVYIVVEGKKSVKLYEQSVHLFPDELRFVPEVAVRIWRV